jgi:hypothetical protein
MSTRRHDPWLSARDVAVAPSRWDFTAAARRVYTFAPTPAEPFAPNTSGHAARSPGSALGRPAVPLRASRDARGSRPSHRAPRCRRGSCSACRSRRDSRQEMQRLEHDVCRAVAPRLAKAVDDTAVRQDSDTLEALGQARAIAEEAFEAVAVKGTHRDAGILPIPSPHPPPEPMERALPSAIGFGASPSTSPGSVSRALVPAARRRRPRGRRPPRTAEAPGRGGSGGG